MPQNPIVAYKNLGETPLECLERVRLEQGISADIPMTYAGRLDPMAEGVLLILWGEACKEKEKYLGLDKTYEFQILSGFATDTYDLLGIVKDTTPSKVLSERSSDLPSRRVHLAGQTVSSSTFDSVDKIISQFTGTFIQKYPSFSSKTVEGRQLFERAKENELPKELPKHTITIFKLSCTSTMILRKEELEKEIEIRISLVKGDFRQSQILEKWKETFKKSQYDTFEVISCVCECSSGTYIRQLVHDMAEKLNLLLVTYSIKRTKVGEYKKPV